jgi:lactoylglutathione lyase
MITGIAHNGINVIDMDKAMDFYCGAVGLKKIHEIPKDGKPWVYCLKIAKNNFVELFYGGVKDREDAYAADQIGYHHWCIICTDLQSLRDRIFKKGYIDESLQPKPTPAGGKTMWIHDPEGNALELIQRLPDAEYGGRDELLGIGHTGFIVSDMEKSLDFYINKLGLKQIRTMDKEGKPWLIFLQVQEGQNYELYHGGNRTRPNTWQSYGSSHLSLLCDDLEATLEALRAKVVPVDAEIKLGGDKNLKAWIHDPDGNRIELLYVNADSPLA